MKDTDLYDILCRDDIERTEIEQLCAPVPISNKIQEFYTVGILSQDRAEELYTRFGRPVNQEVLEMRVEGPQSQGLAVDWSDMVEYLRRQIRREQQ
jgi:hypothetical protein